MMLELQKRVIIACVYIISWPDQLFEPNSFVQTFLTGEGRSGQWHVSQFRRIAEQSCTPLDGSSGGGITLRRGKSHIGKLWSGRKPKVDFSVTFLYFVLGPTKISFCFGGK